MKLAVVGQGYVALVTGVCFAGMGHSVVCAGVETEHATLLQKGKAPFYEEGFEALLNSELERGQLSFTANVTEAISHAQIVYLCVSAPTQPNGQPDLKPLQQTVELMREALLTVTQPVTLVVCSTLPVQATALVYKQLTHPAPEQGVQAVPETSLYIACVPHFLREGHAVKDFYHPDRVVIGADQQACADLLVRLYSPLGAPLFLTDSLNAELIKLSSNAFLAMKISFINTIGHLCEKLGADVTQVAKGMGMDSRISAEFLNAGLGYGGVFFPRDLQSLINVGEQHGLSLDLLKATDVINRYQRISLMDGITEVLGGDLEGKTVAVWGLAYRPNTDDMRDAPSTQIVWGLQNRGANIRVYDPLAMENAKSKLRNVVFTSSLYEAAVGADCIAILTEWEAFAQVDFKRLKEESTCRLIVDGRNLYSPKRLEKLGFSYHSMGRPSVSPKL
jgi:UDPglucose 6-dehydrogenase